MSKTLAEAQLTTKNARAKLDRGIHWRGIDPDVHLGYRKGARGGRWVVRWYRGDGEYQQLTLAAADDALPANGAETLDYGQAVLKARDAVAQARTEAKALRDGPILTVSRAVEEYFAFRADRYASDPQKGSLSRDVVSRLSKYVLGTPLAAKPLHRLDDKDLRDWKANLPTSLAPATVRRLVNDLKACLNLAGTKYRKRLPADYGSTVKFGLRTDLASSAPARRQVLTDDQVRSLIGAAKAYDVEDGWDGDLYRLIHVLASTGARLSQVTRIAVGDVLPARKVIMTPVSRKGRGAKQVEHIGVPVAQDLIDALSPILNDRESKLTLLERWRHKQTDPNTWTKDRRGPWKTASELTRPWAEIVKRTDLPSDTLPYALRHSSIVRGLRQGLPTRLVAALHDTSSAMIEKHYSAYISDALEDLAARAVVPLG